MSSDNEDTRLIKVVIPLHGIRTRAEWQKSFTQLAHEKGFYCPLDNWNFGYFSVIRFLLSAGAARKSLEITWQFP
jgi:hypothetical protein